MELDRGPFGGEKPGAGTDDFRCDRKARAKGVKFGRKLKLSPFQIAEAKRKLEAGESQAEVGRLFGVSYQTIGRL